MPYDSQQSARAGSAVEPGRSEEAGATPWHALLPDDVVRRQDTDPRAGLGDAAAAERLARLGRNVLPEAERLGPVKRLLQQFSNLLIYVLLGAAVVMAVLGHWIDAGVILGVVIINAAIGFVQEGKAENALAAVASLLSPTATVTRDGTRKTIPAEELVPGDIVHLASGDRVPADLRLISSRGLQVDEAALTGESVPAEKDPAVVPETAPLAERTPLAHSGTLVVGGRATGVVVATGAATEIGRISGMMTKVEPLTTPLLRQMARFAKWLTVAILGLAAFAFAFGTVVRGYGVDEMFLAAVGLAVAAIPEGLPAILTITLAIGVSAMAGRQAIIRRLPAVETLGAVTVICSDKTGTLTRNEMTVRQIVAADATFDVSGEAYGADGAVTLGGQPVDMGAWPQLRAAVEAAVHCNDAELLPAPEAPGGRRLQGNPVDGALLAVGLKTGDPDAGKPSRQRHDWIPFESAHKFMASLHDGLDGNRVVYLKGAPERVLDLCRLERTTEGERPLDGAGWQARADALAREGYRLLAVAERVMPADHKTLAFEHVEDGDFTLLGIFALRDPARTEAAEAIRACRDAGIRVKMITGDHAATADAVARELGITGPRAPLTGHDLDQLDEAALADVVREVDVYARTSPEHKLRLVRALQAHGEVAAMTGDGVNDAPALKRADIGVAMGRRGTEAAKQAAEMVLADDNFASIAAAVQEGRIVYDKLIKAILFILPTNGAQAGALLAAIGLGTLLPITPLQILWVNMVTAVTLALALSFERGETDVMNRPPRRADAPILSGFMLWRIAFVSGILVAAVLGMFLVALDRGTPVDEARTLAVNMLVACEIAYLFSVRMLSSPALTGHALATARPALIATGLVLGLQALFTYAPPVQLLFDTAPLSGAQLLQILGMAVLVLGIVEAEKAVLRRVRGSPAPRSRASAPGA